MIDHKVDEEEVVGKIGFWLVVPFLLLFVGALFYLAWLSGRGSFAYALVTLVSLPVLLAILGLYDGRRFWWARRGIGLYVFLGCLSYAISQGRMGTASIAIRWETEVEYLVVALSALRYALTGKLWVSVVHIWFSRLLAPLARVNIGGTHRRQKQADTGNWYSHK